MEAPYVGMKGRMILDGDFTPAFRLDGAAKDLALITDAARAAGVDVGVVEEIRAHFDRAVDAGHGDKDMAATYLAHKP
jgi:3-hydroxyisobutyrate dehydrogenase